jgi:hypothetical protein
MPGPVKDSKGVFNLAGFGWFDYGRTEQLWSTVYTGKQALLNQKRWIDPSSSSIPFSYLLTAAAIGEGRTRTGDKDSANKMYAEARDIARVTGLESYLAPGNPAATETKDSPTGG